MISSGNYSSRFDAMDDSASNHPVPAEPCDRPAPASFAALSGRIMHWTTNGLATGLILVAGFAFGRQVLVWWRQTPPAAPIPATEPLAPSEAQHLEFGALATTLRTRSLDGNRRQVVKQLAELCRPSGRPQKPLPEPVSAAERRLLAELAGKTPLATGDGWRIDELGEPMPLVVCSTWTSDAGGDRRTSAKAISPLPLPLDLRIIAIAMAIPSAGGGWTAYAFDVSGSAADAGQSGPPLPPGSRRVLRLRQEDGTVLNTFRGLAQPAAWEEHFAGLAPDGWRLVSAGTMAGGRWQGELIRGGEKPLRAVVHFEYDGQGWLHGLSLVSPTRDR